MKLLLVAMERRGMANSKVFSDDMNRLLIDEDIYRLLDGDTEFEIADGVMAKMPYLSGPRLSKIAQAFGLPNEYKLSGSPSRWKYVEAVIKTGIEEKRFSQALEQFLPLDDRSQFSDGSGLSQKERIDGCIRAINKHFELARKELRFESGVYHVVDANTPPIEVVPDDSILVDSVYINQAAMKATMAIDREDYAGALTQARTLLEETFCQVVEAHGELPSAKHDFTALFKQVKSMNGLNKSEEIERLLSNLTGAVAAIGRVRNIAGDAHGHGSANRVQVNRAQALFVVRTAVAISEYVLTL